MILLEKCRRRARRSLWNLLHARRPPHNLLLTCGRAKLLISSQSVLAPFLYEGSFESDMQTFLFRYLRPGMCVLDIGANIGLYTVQMASAVGEAGHVYAFEPCPLTAARLRENVTLNRLSNVSIVEKALSDSEGTAHFYIFPEGGDAYNSLGAVRREREGLCATQLIEVQTTTLDAFANQAGLTSVDFIKLDVEGAEEMVLRGGVNLLRACPQALIAIELYEPSAVQCGSSANSIINMMLSLDYQPYFLRGGREDLYFELISDLSPVLQECTSRGIDLIFSSSQAVTERILHGF